MARRKTYGQFCPVAQAAEIVAERWTPLVLRELLSGSRRFSDLKKGVPLMSPSLLSRRLKELEDAGVVVRVKRRGAAGAEYRLTPAGEDLRSIIELLGLWGHRWVQREIRREELDPALLMWDIRRCIDRDKFPAEGRTVVQFNLTGAPHPKGRWWLVVDGGDVDLCLKSPGYAVDLEVTAHIRDMVKIWLGRVELDEALRGGSIRLEGDAPLVRGFKDWFSLSTLARGMNGRNLVAEAQPDSSGAQPSPVPSFTSGSPRSFAKRS